VSDADHTLAYLLDLDGEAIVYDGGYVARFRVRRIEATAEKPHGISSPDFFDEIGHILKDQNHG
jgi:hypothetical protein